MKTIDHEEAAMAIQYIYEDELDNTNTDNELLEEAVKSTRKAFPELNDTDIIKISREIYKLHKPYN